MKKFVFLTLFFFSSLSGLEEPKKTVCLNMIVKNEKDVITRCLKSVLPVIDTWVIVDTGSTDGTQEIIKTFLKDIPGKLYERPWVDFGYNRNEALSLAKDLADYVLFMDADDELVFSGEFTLPDLSADFYYMPAGGKSSEFVIPRFVKTSLNWFWKGKIHEYVVASQETSGVLLKGVEYHYINDGARSKNPETYRRDLDLLQQAIYEEPHTPRNYYYLAMTYLRLGEFENALAAHERRANMPGWKEEAFVSKLYMGLLQHALKKDIRTVRNSFLNAYLFYPQRAEPLFYLIETFQHEGMDEKAYEVAKMAVDLSLKKNGSVLVEAWMYDFGFLLKYALLSFQTNRFSESIQACETLLSKKDLPEARQKEVQECYEKALKAKSEEASLSLKRLLLNL